MTTCKETINCLSYSNAPEELSIKMIAGGLSSGTIRYVPVESLALDNFFLKLKMKNK